MKHNTSIDPSKAEQVRRLADFEGRTIEEITLNAAHSVTFTFTDGTQVVVNKGEYSGIGVSVTAPVTKYQVVVSVGGDELVKQFDDAEEADTYRERCISEGVTEPSDVVEVTQ